MALLLERGHCFVCNNAYAFRALRRIPEANEEKIQFAISYRENMNNIPAVFNNESRVCINCDRMLNRELEELRREPDCVVLNVLRQRSSHTCMICNSPENRPRLNLNARASIFIELNIYVPASSRCCLGHLTPSGLLLAELNPMLMSVKRRYKLAGAELSSFLQRLRKQKKKNDIDIDSISEEDFKIISPVTKQQFQDLFQYCVPVHNDGQMRYVSEKKLFMFLIKMHQGLSDDFLKVLFKYSYRENVSRDIKIVRQSLLIRFVPQSIGYNAITRDDFINMHVTPFANELYNPNIDNRQAIVIVDASYTYMGKSSNFKSLRKSFSLHKKRHLVKPCLIVAPDGYILDIHGPYFSDSRNNDASILKVEFEENVAGIDQWFQVGDVFLMDRGYRDSVPYLQNKGMHCKMPAVLERGQRQLSTEAANESRIITKSRWIVEARNGHLKSIFKFFDGLLPMAHIIHLNDFLKIAGAIINRYHVNIYMEDVTIPLARELLNRIHDVNLMQARVEAENNLRRRNGNWNILNENNFPQFPRLDMAYLKELTIGTYQINLSPAYIQDKLLMDNNDVFEFDELNEHGLIRLRIRSRFRNAVKHQLWIAFQNETQEDEPILAYYCMCKTGARTIGCCAHVASVVWYLGYARHQQDVKYPSTALLNYILDCANINE